jgi:myo-inositol-1(or 4)-monophosphatase
LQQRHSEYEHYRQVNWQNQLVMEKDDDTSALKASLLQLAKDTVMKAGVLTMNRPDTLEVTCKSSSIDFVTQMDKASEQLIMREILSARPEDGFVGEEGGDIPSGSGITWVVDPIDGTTNYVYNLPGWNISIAAKDSVGQVLVGVVFCPTINRLWTAVKGQGAHMNDKPISCKKNVDQLSDALLGTGFTYDIAKRVEQGAFLASLIPRVRDIRRCGAAAVDLCYVACGALDGYYECGLNEWDYAAGGLIAAEAGAIVTGRNKGPVGKEMIIAAGPKLHAILVGEIA